MNSEISEEFDRYLLESYREVLRQQFLMAKFGVPFEYSDKLSFKEREIYLDILTEDFLPKPTGGQDE